MTAQELWFSEAENIGKIQTEFTEFTEFTDASMPSQTILA